MDIPEIDVDELDRRCAAAGPDDLTLIDVREPDEYAQAHVPGAMLVPLGTLPDHVEELPEGTLYVICRSGARSYRAAEWLAAQGRTSVNVAGGTLAWLESRCQTALAPFAELAQAHGSEIDRKFGIDLPGPDAEVSLRTTDGGKLVFSMRLFCPASRARFVEQEITAALLQHLASVGSPPAAPKP